MQPVNKLGSIDDILRKTPDELLEWRINLIEVPQLDVIMGVEDMKIASSILLILSGYYSYVINILSKAKIMVRQLKRDGLKTEYEDMIDRREILQDAIDDIKQSYGAVSRAVTIYMANQNELQMGKQI